MEEPEGTCLVVAMGILDRHGIGNGNDKLVKEIADAIVVQWRRGWHHAMQSNPIAVSHLDDWLRGHAAGLAEARQNLVRYEMEGFMDQIDQLTDE